jgi:hypothetical protein
MDCVAEAVVPAVGDEQLAVTGNAVAVEQSLD